MQTSITIRFTDSVQVKRATPDDFDGEQQVYANFFPSGTGRTNLTFFAPSVEAAEALVSAMVQCGAVLEQEVLF